ncbi:MAG TPA: 50S ribosomal protein L10, partial [Ferruginibacter sp.]|nr:50S ribosomal protein L10 [Ferruginibacter sp.]
KAAGVAAGSALLTACVPETNTSTPDTNSTSFPARQDELGDPANSFEDISQYNNFYVTDTESLTVADVSKLRRVCFNKQVEMKVAKNTLIKKALESLDAEKYAGVYDSLHKVTALMFSENPKDPAVIISSFRKETNNERPVLKAAFINGDVFVGNDQLKALTQIKTKNELIGEIIGLLQSPIQRVIGALQNRPEAAEAPAEA